MNIQCNIQMMYYRIGHLKPLYLTNVISIHLIKLNFFSKKKKSQENTGNKEPIIIAIMQHLSAHSKTTAYQNTSDFELWNPQITKQGSPEFTSAVSGSAENTKL